MDASISVVFRINEIETVSSVIETPFIIVVVITIIGGVVVVNIVVAGVDTFTVVVVVVAVSGRGVGNGVGNGVGRNVVVVAVVEQRLGVAADTSHAHKLLTQFGLFAMSKQLPGYRVYCS